MRDVTRWLPALLIPFALATSALADPPDTRGAAGALAGQPASSAPADPLDTVRSLVDQIIAWVVQLILGIGS